MTHILQKAFFKHVLEFRSSEHALYPLLSLLRMAKWIFATRFHDLQQSYIRDLYSYFLTKEIPL